MKKEANEITLTIPPSLITLLLVRGFRFIKSVSLNPTDVSDRFKIAKPDEESWHVTVILQDSSKESIDKARKFFSRLEAL